MSNGNRALPLVLGAGGGFLLWYFLRDGKRDASAQAASGPRENQTPTTPAIAVPAAPAAPATPAAPAAADASQVQIACSLRLDANGLAADGARVDVAEAINRCKLAGLADVTVSKDASATTYADLMTALSRAGVPAFTQRNGAGSRNARPRTIGAARNANTYRAFTLVTYAEGRKAGPLRQWFIAEPPTTWADARDRLGAAGFLDLTLAGRTSTPGGWMLSVDPAGFREALAEPLPAGGSDGE